MQYSFNDDYICSVFAPDSSIRKIEFKPSSVQVVVETSFGLHRVVFCDVLKASFSPIFYSTIYDARLELQSDRATLRLVDDTEVVFSIEYRSYEVNDE